MENTEKLKNNKEIIAYIDERFPKCFTLEGDAKPLKIGIFQELAASLENGQKVSKTQLRSALRQYTSSWRYLHSVKLGVKRIDLDGEDCGEIEEEHASHAKTTLNESKARVQARRKEQAKKEYAAAKNKVNPQKNTNKPTPNLNVPKKSAPKPQKEIKESRGLSQDEITVGKKVKVNIGSQNLLVTIVEINKDDIGVQLDNGLKMRVSSKELHA